MSYGRVVDCSILWCSPFSIPHSVHTTPGNQVRWGLNHFHCRLLRLFACLFFGVLVLFRTLYSISCTCFQLTVFQVTSYSTRRLPCGLFATCKFQRVWAEAQAKDCYCTSMAKSRNIAGFQAAGDFFSLWLSRQQTWGELWRGRHFLSYNLSVGTSFHSYCNRCPLIWHNGQTTPDTQEQFCSKTCIAPAKQWKVLARSKADRGRISQEILWQTEICPPVSGPRWVFESAIVSLSGKYPRHLQSACALVQWKGCKRPQCVQRRHCKKKKM